MTSYLKRAREWATPTLKSSAFLERGVLTPEEFVRAGDELVFKCPTWSWGTLGDPRYAVGHLPADKQFLVTRNVPCAVRVESVESASASAALGETIDRDVAEGDGDDDGWLVSHAPSRTRRRDGDAAADTSLEDEFDVLDVNGDVVLPETPPEPEPRTTEDDEDDDDEYADMTDFDDDNIIDDAAAVAAVASSNNNNNNDEDGATKDDNILQTRSYDLSITYDKYYQTPRVWIFGYREDGMTPLTPNEMFEDVMTDYVRRTVTIESHPFVNGPHASIHPCQHGAVMKNIVRNLMGSSSAKGGDDGDEVVAAPAIETYLFIFLKFVSSIIPTINYDFTMEVSANVQKQG